MKKLLTMFNILWWTCVVVNIGSMMWFVLRSTANLQRGIDLVATVILTIFGIPSLILVMYSVYRLKHGGVKSPYSLIGVSVILTIMIFLSVPFFGWFR